MRIKVFTLFPDMLQAMLSQSIIGRAIRSGAVEVELYNIRDYTLDRHRSTDDYPFGGGAGMLMTAQPVVDAIAQNTGPDYRGRRIYLSPRGRTLNQRIVEELAREEELLLLCGHYEGVDQRALDAVIDEELSIGDYVLTGGELGAMVVIDAVARLVPGVLGSADSGEDESFSTGLLEYPQYTRPADFRGAKVPEVLLGGNHADIGAWRREQSLELTLARRPELLETAPLDDADRDLLLRLRRAREVSALLEERGLSCRRAWLRRADRWPRAWFDAFVPGENRAAAKKHCFSGRRHAGFLWRAFSLGFAPCAAEDAAELWLADRMGGAELYLPGDRLLFELFGKADPRELEALGPFMLAEDMRRTYVYTGEPQKGPYFALRPSEDE